MPDPIVLDASGNVRSLDWLRAKYGPFVLYNPPPADGPARVWRITTLREKCNAPATVVVKTLGLDGANAPGVKVAWYWPAAPADADAGPAGAPFDGVTPGHCVAGYANGEGDTGFAMGDGAYYYPDRGERGPHAVWIHGAETRSDLFLGLGMLPGTEHDHIDVEFTLMDDSGEEPEEPEGLAYWFGEIVEQLTRIADALEVLSNG
jgi:hypothetical protein